MRASFATWLVVVLVGLTVGACGSRPLTLRPEPRSFTHNDYRRIYEAWTREVEDFAWGRLEDVLHATATFESWEFRWAYVIRYAHDYGLSTQERAEMLRATLEDAQRHHRFFVTMVGYKFEESDLTGKRSAWRVLLVDENGRTAVPVEVEEVRKIGAVERILFPSVSPQRHAFRISFPTRHPDGTPTIPPDAEHALLRFTGVLGQVDLRWEFAAGQDVNEPSAEAKRAAGASVGM